MSRAVVVPAAVCLLLVTLFPSAGADDLAARAAKLHRRALVVDTHIDVPSRHFAEAHYNVGERHSEGHVDLPRMREGGLDAGFFSIYLSADITGPEAVMRALRLIDWTRRQIERNSREAVIATSAADVRRAHKQGRRAILMGMEGGHMIADDLGVLRMYAALGIRYLTLTHTRHTNWADSSGEDPRHNGLTEFGKEVVRELNRLGVMVDVSHVADKTFWDALEVSRAPLVASHSSCRALCNAPRNMTDEMIKAMAAKGGVIQITYVDAFLSQELRDAQEAVREERERRTREIQERYPTDETARREAMRQLSQELRTRMPKVSWEKIIEHIEHAVRVAGVDHVGLGSDFDGATMPEGLEDCTRLPKITAALLRKGYQERDIEKILGGNLLRVLEQAERVAQQMRAAPGAAR